ncbi:MAG TPA: helix-turn-helix domain-containing protein [Rhizomicrobium sp.]|jgi:AcrR family transcriptional regulator|nr:helix-turn-helix domain-containing protein [Rhizomicrobium sp.]
MIASQAKLERRAKARNATRAAILDAARRVAARDGARNLSLRAAASEAGFAPAALYGYFGNKDELLLALAAEDLSAIARAMRSAAACNGRSSRLAAASAAALRMLQHTETLIAASSALPRTSGSSEPERIFNGRLIAALSALSQATGRSPESRAAQTDVVLLAAALAGLAVFARSGRLAALGFATEELVTRLGARFSDAM